MGALRATAYETPLPVTAADALIAALKALAAALDALGQPAMIIGGIAVIARGGPRQTIDIGATVAAADLDLDQVVETLATHQITPRIANAAAVRSYASGAPAPPPDHRHAARGQPRVAAVRDGRPAACDRRHFGGVRVRVATAEDLIVLKAVAWRDRDRGDIERLLLLHREEVDLERVRALISEFGAAIDEPERLGQFNALVSRTLGQV